MRSKPRKAILALLASLAVLYALDYAAWRIRGASGTGSVTVNQFLKTPLKGQKEGYDYLGEQDTPCARAIFPHGGMSACWWLARHSNQWE